MSGAKVTSIAGQLAIKYALATPKQSTQKHMRFKIGLVDIDGNWVGNVWVPPYDMGMMVRWQKFEQNFVTTERTASGSIDISKGSESARSIVMFIADFKLEMLGEPKLFAFSARR
ncbi:MAG: hypothetical protein NZ781_12635 [Armatimonadetes bacterium]|nr:hypothetical protein [Armatimonadota bacterium]